MMGCLNGKSWMCSLLQCQLLQPEPPFTGGSRSSRPEIAKRIPKRVFWGNFCQKVPEHTRKSLELAMKVRNWVFCDFSGIFGALMLHTNEGALKVMGCQKAGLGCALLRQEALWYTSVFGAPGNWCTRKEKGKPTNPFEGHHCIFFLGQSPTNPLEGHHCIFFLGQSPTNSYFFF